MKAKRYSLNVNPTYERCTCCGVKVAVSSRRKATGWDFLCMSCNKRRSR